eukprot:TRINITY_DN21358_c0_g2_i1.p1 TRINITY_DN21358_c0_g2~~TRINITY_DN21358_c0_g2_i1.p1  ORF type:complete len:117 (-),score=21.19 TRINITY_DN21358_c0_g2_i1:123-473(-)
MIRRPPRSTQGVSSAASDVYKRQVHGQDSNFRNKRDEHHHKKHHSRKHSRSHSRHRDNSISHSRSRSRSKERNLFKKSSEERRTMIAQWAEEDEGKKEDKKERQEGEIRRLSLIHI